MCEFYRNVSGGLLIIYHKAGSPVLRNNFIEGSPGSFSSGNTIDNRYIIDRHTDPPSEEKIPGRLEQPRQNQNLSYRHDEPSKQTRKNPLV
jgi:hypothetical protein